MSSTSVVVYLQLSVSDSCVIVQSSTTESNMFNRFYVAIQSLLNPLANAHTAARTLSSQIAENSQLPEYCVKSQPPLEDYDFMYGGKKCYMIEYQRPAHTHFFDEYYSYCAPQQVIDFITHDRIYVYCFGDKDSTYSHKVIISNQYIPNWEDINDYDGTVGDGIAHRVTYASDAQQYFLNENMYEITENKAS